MGHRHRRMRGGYGIPFVFPFIMFFAFRSVSAFVATLVLAIVIMLVLRALTAMAAANNVGGMGNARQQQSYYQPPQTYYQPTYQSPSVQQSYEQGYQAVPETYRVPGHEEPKAPSQYEQYEQPQAQYPEQMPPMQ